MSDSVPVRDFLTSRDALTLATHAAEALGLVVATTRVERAYSARYSFAIYAVGEEQIVIGNRIPPQPHNRSDLVLLASPVGQLVAFRLPHDPFLPGLPAIMSGEGQLVAYRPGRRAVVKFPNGTYAKTTQPHTFARLAHNHEVCATAGLPVPQIVERAEHHIVVTRRTGTNLLAMLDKHGPHYTAERVEQLLDILPSALLTNPVRPSWCAHIDYHARMAAAAAPTKTDLIHHIAAQVRQDIARQAAHPPGPVVPTHGDLYEANILTDGDTITGLLDIDTAGPGHRIDDYACLLGHLAVSPRRSAAAEHRHMVKELWQACAGATPHRLAVRTAGIILTLVAGARRDQRREDAAQLALANYRVDLAYRWLQADPPR